MTRKGLELLMVRTVPRFPSFRPTLGTVTFSNRDKK
jgi:hypothetical protein